MPDKVPIHKSDILHALNRGVLKIDIFKTDHDWWRFLEILRYKNHSEQINRWQNDVSLVARGHQLPWPDSWSPQDPLVRIDAYILMDNHYHLILTEIRDGGISDFMKKIGNTYTSHFQMSHDWDERLFTGTYKSVHVLSDNQLRKLFIYVLVKNAFERFNGGIRKAIENFDEAFKEARKYPFSSLGEAMGDREARISSNELFNQTFSSPKEFRLFARDQMKRYRAYMQEIDDLTLE